MISNDMLNSIGYIVALPDFYIDRIVKVDSFEKLVAAIDKKLERGGSIRGIEQFELKGGNATNLAYAIAKIGAKSVLITGADEYGEPILRDVFADLNTNLIIKYGKQGYTTSLEINNTNVMISDSGINEHYNLDIIKDEIEILKGASAVAITNWASNLDGNELVEGVFSFAENALHFLDPADISERVDEFVSMLRRLNTLIDVLSINENEFKVLTRRLDIKSDDIINGAYELAKELQIRIDIHTPSVTVTTNGKDLKHCKTFDLDAKIVTGAGDVWDAADIIAYLSNISDHDRLLFANAAASLYIVNAKAPTLDDILAFIEAR